MSNREKVFIMMKEYERDRRSTLINEEEFDKLVNGFIEEDKNLIEDIAGRLHKKGLEMYRDSMVIEDEETFNDMKIKALKYLESSLILDYLIVCITYQDE